jgi:hypothetical protein
MGQFASFDKHFNKVHGVWVLRNAAYYDFIPEIAQAIREAKQQLTMELA